MEYTNEKLLNLHLDSWFTLQAKNDRESSHWFVIDVDSQNRTLLEKCISALQDWIPREFIHISYSGNKGYHIELYFAEPVKNDRIKNLCEWIFEKTKLNLEFFPSSGKKSIKLPLGYNHNTGNFCCYLNHKMQHMPIEESYEYFLSIKPIPFEYLCKIPKPEVAHIDYGSNSKVISTSLEMLQIPSVATLLNSGLNSPNTRHTATYKLCLDLRMKGYVKQEARDFLWQWSMREFKEGRTKTSPKEFGEDIDGIIKFIYKPGFKVHYPSTRNGPINISPSDYEFLCSINSRSDSEKRVLLALIIHAKQWAKEDGSFSFSINQICEATSLIKKTAIRALKRLENKKVVHLIKKGNSIRRRANQYILAISIENKNIGLILKPNHYLSLEQVQKYFETGVSVGIKDLTDIS